MEEGGATWGFRHRTSSQKTRIRVRGKKKGSKSTSAVRWMLVDMRNGHLPNVTPSSMGWEKKKTTRVSTREARTKLCPRKRIRGVMRTEGKKRRRVWDARIVPAYACGRNIGR